MSTREDRLTYLRLNISIVERNIFESHTHTSGYELCNVLSSIVEELEDLRSRLLVLEETVIAERARLDWAENWIEQYGATPEDDR